MSSYEIYENIMLLLKQYGDHKNINVVCEFDSNIHWIKKITLFNTKLLLSDNPNISMFSLNNYEIIRKKNSMSFNNCEVIDLNYYLTLVQTYANVVGEKNKNLKDITLTGNVIHDKIYFENEQYDIFNIEDNNNNISLQEFLKQHKNDNVTINIHIN